MSSRFVTDDKWILILGALFIALIVISWGFFAKGWIDCKNQDGAWVQGAIWYECVATP